MSDRLTVNSGETHTVEGGDTEEWSGADVEGTLDVDGTLKLIDNPDTPSDSEFVRTDPPLDLPLGPLNMYNMDQGFAIFLVGFLGLELGAVAFLKNYVAGILLFFSIFALLSSGLLGIGLELFWAFTAATALALIMGMVVLWIN